VVGNTIQLVDGQLLTVVCWAGRWWQVLEMQGTIMETPPSLRDAQSERKVGQLNEKLRMLESELGRFLGRQATDQREKREREYLLSGAERRCGQFGEGYLPVGHVL
jgi:hypothetical protein